LEIILPQIVAVGIYHSQIAVKNRTVTRNRKTTMFELELPIEKGGISYINSEKSPIEPDMIICAKPGQIRHTRVPYKCYYIHMILQRGALYDSLMDTPNYVRINRYPYYSELFCRMCEHYDTALEYDEMLLQSLVLELIYAIRHDSEKLQHRAAVKNSNYEAIEKVLKYVEQHLTADLSLETLAEYAGFSPIHFHNCFKAATGKTLRDYVEEQRIKQAVNLLATTDATLAEIAYECGFSSQSYFSYAFKRRMHLTPREYTRKLLERYENN